MRIHFDTMTVSHSATRKGNTMSTAYTGPERRVADRRKGVYDRREMVRYEINKLPRRSGKDRRTVYGWEQIPGYQTK